jgi:2-methylaconitate cis-trans-isomerase PrpF
VDLRVRPLFMNRLHESIAGSGSICLAAADQAATWGQQHGLTYDDLVSQMGGSP